MDEKQEDSEMSEGNEVKGVRYEKLKLFAVGVWSVGTYLFLLLLVTGVCARIIEVGKLGVWGPVWAAVWLGTVIQSIFLSVVSD